MRFIEVVDTTIKQGVTINIQYSSGEKLIWTCGIRSCTICDVILYDFGFSGSYLSILNLIKHEILV